MNGSIAGLCMALLLTGLNICMAIPVFAQSKQAVPTPATIALFDGEDRLQRLIEGARKEGGLTLYHSMATDDMAPVIDAFAKKYGVRVRAWRSSGENVLQRVVTEARGGRFEADMTESGAQQAESLRREKMLQPVKSPYHAGMMPQAIPAHGEWAAATIDIFVQAYNTDRIKKEDLPKTFQDLLDPKWKGSLGIEADDPHWFATLLQELGEDKGKRLFRDIVDANGMSVRKGHSLLANMVVSGEVPLALTLYQWNSEKLKKQKGAPIESFIIPPAIAQLRPIGLLRKAPHPYAAVLFYDFMLSDEAQLILSKRFLIPTSNKIDIPLKKLPLKVIDPALFLDMNDKWTQAYEDVITRKTKQ
jgi:iron(III) transport system substrate-binding protein